MTHTIEDPDFLTLSEAADMLAGMRISRRTLQRTASTGRLPGVVRVGRDYRIPRKTVLRIRNEGLSSVVSSDG